MVTSLPPEFGDVMHVLIKHGRFIVGKGKGFASNIFCPVDNILRPRQIMMYLLQAPLGKMPVMAKLTTIVATCGSGPHVIARLLFDGIDLQGRGLSISNAIIGSIAIFTIAAKSPASSAHHAFSKT